MKSCRYLNVIIFTSSAANFKTAVKGVFSGTLSLYVLVISFVCATIVHASNLHFIWELGVRGQSNFEGHFGGGPGESEASERDNMILSVLGEQNQLTWLTTFQVDTARKTMYYRASQIRESMLPFPVIL